MHEFIDISGKLNRDDFIHFINTHIDKNIEIDLMCITSMLVSHIYKERRHIFIDAFEILIDMLPNQIFSNKLFKNYSQIMFECIDIHLAEWLYQTHPRDILVNLFNKPKRTSIIFQNDATTRDTNFIASMKFFVDVGIFDPMICGSNILIFVICCKYFESFDYLLSLGVKLNPNLVSPKEDYDKLIKIAKKHDLSLEESIYITKYCSFSYG